MRAQLASVFVCHFRDIFGGQCWPVGERWPARIAGGGGSGMAGGVLFVDLGATWREVSPVIAGHVATGGGSGGHVAERK